MSEFITRFCLFFSITTAGGPYRPTRQLLMINSPKGLAFATAKMFNVIIKP